MIVVTGATGNVGRVLVQTLTGLGEEVTAVSRGQAPVPDGVRHHRADLGRPGALEAPLRGAKALFLLVSGAGAHVDAGELTAVVRRSGVERVVLLSSQAAGTRPQSVSHAPLRKLEDAVRAASTDWTILRPGGFATNAYAWAQTVRDRREVAAPFADVGLPVIDPDDIAAVAAAALTQDGHAGVVHELTGPALSTPRERAQALAEALGEPVRFVEQTPEQARAQLLTFMPEPVVEGTLDILGRPTAAEQQISPAVEQILGRPPRTFGDWARRNVAAFA
ncbi:NmrA family transcriptional regulator [Kineosporia sp. NBRC 101677]|uniref:NAD(P)H-binding protein n=1 Tax=Kineosporia sp. NBRC 101677 TaxID=3032197 RepID=UPI0024A58C53|nr:NAD(P)H-binding protein [Kineosporia sp. NBRC 101677]GLY18937.1 NmrA family transcriptional regulator [Kineosporia sp. NBRC 101677]